MAGNFEQPVSGTRICYSCGSQYPDDFRFCPRDSTDLEYPPRSPETVSDGLRLPAGTVKRAVIRGIAAILLIAAGFLLNSLVRSIAPVDIDHGDLTVKTTPAGASVYLDGSPVGISPVRLSDIPTGFHEIRAMFPGYQDSLARVEIRPSASQKLFWDLSPLPQNLESTDKKRFIAELRSLARHPNYADVLPYTRSLISDVSD